MKRRLRNNIKPQRLRYLKTLLLVFLGLAIVIEAAFLLTQSKFLIIQKIIVEPQNACVTAKEINDRMKLIGKNILLVNEQKLVRELSDNFVCLDGIGIQKSWSNKIIITSNLRQKLARIAGFNPPKALKLEDMEASPSTATALINWSWPESSRSNLVVDKKGAIFLQGDSEVLPYLYYPDPDLKFGQKLDEQLFTAVSFIFQKLADEFGTSFEAKIENENLLVKTVPKVIFSLQKVQKEASQQDIFRQVASLQLIVHKSKIESKPMESIDLRFERPVVIYSPTKK